MGICETLISQDLYKEAYGMIREFGEEGLRIKRLLKLCTKLIAQNLAEADDLLFTIWPGGSSCPEKATA